MRVHTLCRILLILVAGEVAAADGKLLVNGFEIPNRWMENYSRHHNTLDDSCKPEINEYFLIEQMVSLVLPVQEADTRGLTLPLERKQFIESWLDKADDFPDDTDPSFNAKGEVIYLRFRRFNYTKLLAKEYSDDEVLAEYKERVIKKDPILANRQIVKVLEFPFSSRSDAENIQSIYAAGGDYLAAAKQLLDEYDFNSALESAEKWTALEFPKIQTDGSPEFKVGDNYVSKTKFWWLFQAVVASDIVPKIGFEEEFPGGHSTMKQDIALQLRNSSHAVVLDELRSEATVTLDGTVVPKPKNYEDILNRSSHRVNLTMHLCSDF